MSKVLVIGCGGVASVAISKCCQVSDVFTELCIASRTKSKCDALAAKLAPTTRTKITTAQIAAEPVAIIAGPAATEADGVASMAGNITNELVSKLGMKNLSKGVKVDVLDGVVCVDLALNLKYGYEIPATCKNVQEKVKTAIENMTGLEVSDVNVAIAGVNMEQTK